MAEEPFHFSHHKAWQSGLYSKLLVKADDLRVVLIAMEVEAKMNEHHPDGTITIRALHGVLRLRIQEKSQDLQGGQILMLAPGIKQDIEARDEVSGFGDDLVAY